jgi:hypothetical protein
MMTNKPLQVAKAEFLAGHASDLGTPLTQVVLPLCGGVVGEAIAPTSTGVAQKSQSKPTQINSLGVSASTTIQWGEVAIALMIAGTVLAWLTTIPLWWPQPQFQTYSTTLSDASLPIMNL